ncbi:MAG: hypothetical protein ACLQBY_02540 [Solirubrobacteraceae bacterium]
MPTKIVLAPGYEVIVSASYDDVLTEIQNPIRGGAVPFKSTKGGRVLINPGHITLISEEPDAVGSGPFGLGTTQSGSA